MRRRLGLFIPIVLLAVLVQWLAPIAAFRVVAAAWSDPLSMASICSGMTTSADAHTETSVPASHAQSDCCAFCAGHHGGALAIDPPSPIFVALQLRFRKLAWLDATEPVPTLRQGSNAQARAPPSLS